MYRLKYLRYFAYLAWNWNIRLAWFIVVREIRGERRYGLQTTGINELRSSLSLEDWAHASIYQPVNFYTAERLFARIMDSSKTQGFIDAGCGMGRVMAMAAAKGFRRIYAFDLSPEMCATTVMLAQDLERRYPDLSIAVDCENAKVYPIPDDAGLLFLFNPFDQTIMAPLAMHVVESLQNHPRPFSVLYANPVHKQIWLDLGFKETFHFRKMTYLEGSVLEFGGGVGN